MDIYEDTLPMGAPSIPNFIEDDLPYISQVVIIPFFRAACKGTQKKGRLPRHLFLPYIATLRSSVRPLTRPLLGVCISRAVCYNPP